MRISHLLYVELRFRGGAMNMHVLQFPRAERRDAYQTIEGWVLGVLLEVHAVTECQEHGFYRDLGDPDALRQAKEIAVSEPFRSASPAETAAAIETVIQSIGDICPSCG